MSTSYAHTVDMALKNLSNGSIAILLGVVTAGVTAVGIIMTIATTQMFGLTGRIDTLYSDIGTMKADAARTAGAVERLTSDIAEMKVTLKAVSVTLESINNKLAAADIKGVVFLPVRIPGQQFVAKMSCTPAPRFIALGGWRVVVGAVGETIDASTNYADH